MKKTIFRSLTLLLALTWLVPKADAEARNLDYWFELTSTPTWKAISNTSVSGMLGYQAAVSPSGSVYVLSRDTKVNALAAYYMFNASGYNTYSSGSSSVGSAITFDDKGNVIYHGNYSTTTTTPPQQAYYKVPTRYAVKQLNADETFGTFSYIELEVALTSAHYYVDATGDFTRGKSAEAYLWYATSADGTITALDCSQAHDVGSTALRDRTASKKLVFNTGIKDPEQTENYVQFYDTSDKTAYKCMMQLRGTGIYDVTLNLNTQEVVSCVKIPDSDQNSSSMSAHIFTLAGSKFLARQLRYPSGSVTNTRFQIMNIDDPNAPVQVGGTPDPFPNASSLVQVGVCMQSRKVSDTEMEIYAYSPGQGVAAYKFTAHKRGAAVTNINAVCAETEDVNYPGRQDMTITWTAPTSGTISGYNIYYKQYYKNFNEVDYESRWTKLNDTPVTATSYLHKDVKWIALSSGVNMKFNKRSYAYTIEPVYSDGFGQYADTKTLTPEFIPICPRWLENGVPRNYEGNCKVQFFWQYPGYGLKPSNYNVWRKNVNTGKEEKINLYEDGSEFVVSAFNYVDQTVVPDQTYTYRVESKYEELTADVAVTDATWERAYSTPSEEVAIAIRDYAKPGYVIEKVYEYAITQSVADEVYTDEDGVIIPGKNNYPANFGHQVINKQGVWYKGNWYITQLTTDTYPNTGSSYVAFDGGILKVNADDPRLGCEKILTLEHRQNHGIAVDESGTFFMRELDSDWSSLAADVWRKNYQYQYRLNRGRLYNPEKGLDVVVDLTGIDLTDDSGEHKKEAEKLGDTTMPGRVDYYCMKGDLINDTYCYLYLAPSVTDAVYVVKLQGNNSKGAVPTVVTASLVVKYEETGSSTLTGKAFRFANENYAFPVNCEGRAGEEFVHELRSNVYGLHSADGSTEKTNIADHIIYQTESRVNSTGGFTFEFNGELFIITPQGQNSVNSGNFFVGVGRRFLDDGSGIVKEAKEADLTDIIPMAQWYTGKPTSAYSDANGLWIYAEEAKDDNGNIVDENKDGQADYAYIWTYRSGYLFGKYILRPTSLFPPTQIYLEVEPQYVTDPTDADKGTDLVQYNAEVHWSDIPYNVTEGGNVLYNISGFTVLLKDDTGAVVGTLEVDVTYSDVPGQEGLALSATDKSGNAIDFESELVTSQNVKYYKNTFNYTFSDVDAIDDEGNQRKFTSEVVVHYVGVEEGTTKGLEFTSDQTYYEGQNGYEPVAPTVTVTNLERTNGQSTEGNPTGEKYDQWADWDGDGVKSKDDGYWQRYDVVIDIDEPETDEPVSYYVVEIDKDGDGTPDETVTITDGGKYTLGSGEPYAGYADGTGAGMIPGTYDFADPEEDESVLSFPVLDYVGGTDFNPEKGEPQDDGNPSEWTYTVTAVYAGGNEQITQTASSEAVNPINSQTTDVKVIGVDTYFSVYPVPASVSVTIKSSEAIEDVAIYTIAGVEVKAVDGNGANVMNVEVEDLAAGYYLLKVNDRAPVKIVVK